MKHEAQPVPVGDDLLRFALREIPLVFDYLLDDSRLELGVLARVVLVHEILREDFVEAVHQLIQPRGHAEAYTRDEVLQTKAGVEVDSLMEVILDLRDVEGGLRDPQEGVNPVNLQERLRVVPNLDGEQFHGDLNLVNDYLVEISLRGFVGGGVRDL